MSQSEIQSKLWNVLKVFEKILPLDVLHSISNENTLVHLKKSDAPLHWTKWSVKTICLTARQSSMLWQGRAPYPW